MGQRHIIGCILGTAVGDALGLPYEGLSPERGVKLWGFPNQHHFLLRYGMVSDDTEHTCMVAQALIASCGEVGIFKRSLAWRLRFWLLGLPAGVGFATLRSLLRLWIGFSPDRSGVFSAGNGPSMRAAVIGTAVQDIPSLQSFVCASSRITHSDPKAEYGALTIALAARIASLEETFTARSFLSILESILPPEAEEFLSLVKQVVISIEQGESTSVFSQSMGWGQGVSGYTYHSVPVALHAWLSHPKDFRAALTAVIGCGGDTDTTGAMVGGIVGASVGRAGIPCEWLDTLCEWPRSVGWMEALGRQLSETRESGEKRKTPSLPFYGIIVRNLFFLCVVLIHGFRRIFPPY